MRYLLLVFTFAYYGCASFPPLTIGAGFMGADVHVSTPGWSSPVKVAASPIVTEPILMVPSGTIKIAQSKVAAISYNESTDKTVVPMVESPVNSPTLLVPSQK